MIARYSLWFIPSALLLTILLWNFGLVLTISSNDTKDIVWSHSVSEGEPFIIRYTHSVARTDVDEVIRIGDHKLVIDSTIYESFGAGLPSSLEPGQTIRREEGKVIIDHINQPMPAIDLYIGQVIANHTLLFQGDTIPLSTLGKPGTSIQFVVSSDNLLKRVMRRVMD